MSVKPHYQTILLSHLDLTTTDAILETIDRVLRNNRGMSEVKRREISRKLMPFKQTFRAILSKKRLGGGERAKKSLLAQVGGGPMTYVFRQAVPLLLNGVPSPTNAKIRQRQKQRQRGGKKKKRQQERRRKRKEATVSKAIPLLLNTLPSH